VNVLSNTFVGFWPCGRLDAEVRAAERFVDLQSNAVIGKFEIQNAGALNLSGWLPDEPWS